jgi:hypothetical protein
VGQNVKEIKEESKRLAEKIVEPAAKTRTNSFPRGKIEIG